MSLARTKSREPILYQIQHQVPVHSVGSFDYVDPPTIMIDDSVDFARRGGGGGLAIFIPPVVRVAGLDSLLLLARSSLCRAAAAR